ncbi:MAG TPA: ABC transporter permease, partial [Pseudomonadota bacterium]|nr:ABC transporter permease [Pseudomonadota bacterium]
MNALWAIARRESGAQWRSPLAWSLLALATVLYAWWFLAAIEAWTEAAPRFAGDRAAPGVTDLVVAPFLASVAAAFIYLVPLATMRLVCGERRDGTLALLASAGTSDFALVAGKWLGALGFVLALVAIAAAMSLSLSLGTSLDLGKLAAGLLGLAVLGMALTALGILASAYAQHPAGAATAAAAAGVLLWILDGAARARGETDG